MDSGGLSYEEAIQLIRQVPTLFKNQIKPALDLVRSFVNTDKDLIKIIMTKNNAFLLQSAQHRKSIEANIHVLRQHGVPDSEILHLILTKLYTLVSTPKVFKSIVKRIVSLGFNPETRKFVSAVAAMSGMKKSTWDSKTDMLKGLGWSDEHILDAFIRHPKYFTLSVEKMKESIEFYKESSSLNWDASFLSKRPIILDYSLMSEVIPRLAVLKCLMSEDIIKEDKQFVSMLNLNETLFLSRYVFNYQEQLPYLYEVYKKERMLGGCEEDDNGGDRNYQSTRPW